MHSGELRGLVLILQIFFNLEGSLLNMLRHATRSRITFELLQFLHNLDIHDKLLDRPWHKYVSHEACAAALGFHTASTTVYSAISINRLYKNIEGVQYKESESEAD